MKLFKTLVLVCVILMTVCCSLTNEIVVASYDDGTVSAEDFKYFFIREIFRGDINSAYSSDEAKREDFAKRYALYRVKASIFREQFPDYQYEKDEEIAKIKNSILREVLFQRLIEDNYITEDDIKKGYENSKTIYKGFNFFIKDKTEEGEDIADSVLSMLKNSKGYEEIVKKYPRVEFMNNWFESVQVPLAFENALLDKNNNQKPFKVRSSQGFHIFKLDSLKDNPYVKDYFLDREKILVNLRSQYSYEPTKIAELQEILKGVLDKANGKVDFEKIEKIKTLLDSSKGNADVISESMKKDTLITLEDEAYTVEDLLTLINRMSYDYRKEYLKSVNSYVAVLSTRYIRKAIEVIGNNIDAENDDEIKRITNYYIDKHLAGKLNVIEIEKKSEPSEKEMERFYEMNLNIPEFQIGHRDSVSEIFVYFDPQTKEQAFEKIKAIKRKIDNGESFETFATKENSRFKFKKGDLNWISELQFPPVGKHAIKLKEGEVSDIIEGNQFYSIIKVYKKMAPRRKSFYEARYIIKDMMTRKRMPDRKIFWESELVKKYRVKVYNKNLLNNVIFNNK